MSSTTRGEAALGPAVETMRALFAAAACSVALVDDSGEMLQFVASDGAGAEEIVGVSIPVGRGIAGWATMSGQPIAVGDARADARFARDVAESTHYVPDTIFAAPLVDPRGEVLGVASVLDPAVGGSTDRALDVLGAMAGLVALLVVQTREAPGPATSLDKLGADVLALVETWRADPGTDRA